MNGFFASVELLERPDLKNVPMAVSGNPESRHGIILAKNELAKNFGVITAETIWSARRKNVLICNWFGLTMISIRNTLSSLTLFTIDLQIWLNLLALMNPGWMSQEA